MHSDWRIVSRLIPVVLLPLLAGCGSSSDQGAKVDPGALQLVASLQTALGDNSRAESMSLYAPSYTYLGQSGSDAIENLFGGFSLLNSFALGTAFTFNRVSLHVVSYTPQTGGADLVFSAAFGGSWAPFTLNVSGSQPTVPQAAGSATVDLTLGQSGSAWLVVGQRIIASSLGAPGAATASLSNIQINGSLAPSVLPGAALHVTGSASSATALIVTPSLGGEGAQAQLVDLTALARKSRRIPVGRQTVQTLNSLLQQLSLHLTSLPSLAAVQFGADVTAQSSPGSAAVSILALALDANSNVIGENVVTVPYTVQGTPVTLPNENAIIATIPVDANRAGLIVDSTTDKAFIEPALDEAPNVISIVDGSTLKALPSVPVGNGPGAMVICNQKVYVCNSGDNTVSVINIASGTVKTTVSVGAFPGSIAADPSTGVNRVYVANQNDHTISVIDAVADQVVGSAIKADGTPRSLAVNPLNHRLYVGNLMPAVNFMPSPGTVGIIDGPNSKEITAVTVGLGVPVVAVNPALGKVYVENTISGQTISVIHEADNSVTTVNLGQSPLNLSMDTKLGLAYVSASNEILVLNGGAGDAITANIPAGVTGCMATDSTLGLTYCDPLGLNEVLAITDSTNQSTTIPVPSNLNSNAEVQTLGVSSSTGHLFVVNTGDNSVSIVNESALGSSVTNRFGARRSGVTRR